MKALIHLLAGVAAVMYVANGISIASDKGYNPVCLVIGIGCSGAALALWGERFLKSK